MRVCLVLVTLFCFTTWMSMVHAIHGPVANCFCIWWSNTRVPVKRIVNYTIQSEGICPIRAIKFQTIGNRTLCSNPNDDWVRQAILKVDEEKNKKALQEQGQNEDGSKRDISPAASTTSKRAPKKRGRRGRRRQRNKKGKKQHRKCI